jgi:hypothetical protein
MAISRTAWIDDDGTGTTGTVINNAEKTLLYDQIDAALAALVAAGGGGPWIVPPFSAANFTAAPGMAWTVEAADVTSYAYILQGKTLTVRWYIDSTSVSGTPATQLRITIPGGLIAKEYSAQLYIAIDNGAPQVPAYCFVAAGGTLINCYPNVAASGNWTPATNATAMRGTFTFEVQ